MFEKQVPGENSMQLYKEQLKANSLRASTVETLGENFTRSLTIISFYETTLHEVIILTAPH